MDADEPEARYGWVVVAAGAFITCVALGAVFTLPVFLQPITDATGWSRTGVSVAMTLVFLGMGFAGIGWGALSDRYGARIVVLQRRGRWGRSPAAGCSTPPAAMHGSTPARSWSACAPC